MKIVDIATNSLYSDYWGCQENLLSKRKRKVGYNVI